MGPFKRMASASEKDAVPVRGRPAPMTWIFRPGSGREASWPMWKSMLFSDLCIAYRGPALDEFVVKTPDGQE